MFRPLTQPEIAEFRRYAQTHDPDLTQWNVYHPECRMEWIRRNIMPPYVREALQLDEHGQPR